MLRLRQVSPFALMPRRALSTSPQVGNPPVAPKDTHPLRFGILGAARIGPNALIIPAKSHPDVVVAAVASRDSTKATKYGVDHGIAKTYSGPDCYQSTSD